MTQEAHPVCVHPVCVEHALQVWHLNLDLKYWVRLPCVQTCYPTHFLNGAFIILPGPAPLTYAPSSEGSLGLRPLALRPSHFPALYSALRNVSSSHRQEGKLYRNFLHQLGLLSASCWEHSRERGQSRRAFPMNIYLILLQGCCLDSV